MIFDEKNSYPELDDAIFGDFQKLIYDYSGMFFDKDQKYFLEKRLSNRIKALQFRSYKDYYLFLMYDPKRHEEMSLITDLVTTNETYFFREIFQLKAFYEEIVPKLTEGKSSGTLNIWSAGCSTGEEPYTIAMLILEMKERGELSGWDVDIIGSDISHRVLGVARKGVYGPTSFRETEDKYLKYFDEVEGDKKKIKDEVKELVSFNHLNLFDDSKIALLKRMEIIFCRNVLIYFDNSSKKKVVQAFYDKLVNGGYFLLGHSESLMNVSNIFDLQHLRNDMVYQKPSINVNAGVNS